MQDYPLVSVVILNYNGLRYLGGFMKECLDSLVRTDYPNLEIIFVDNGSTDGSVNFVINNFKVPTIKVIKNRHNIIAEGYNRGIKASKGGYIALVSNDMIFDSNWLKPIIELMERDPQIGIAGCKRMLYGTMNVIDGIGTKLSLCGRAVSIGMREIDNGQYDTLRNDLDHIGGAVVVRRGVFHKIGLFDSDYIIWFEDVDFCARVRKKGYKIVSVPSSILWHKPSSTVNMLDSAGYYLHYMGDRSRIRFVIIHFALIRLLATFVIDFAFLLVSSAASKKLLLRAYWWNLKNMPTTLKRRLQYGPSPIGYAHSITGFRRSDILKRLHEIRG